jgi:DNA-binding Xre family transcriptional regulator
MSRLISPAPQPGHAGTLLRAARTARGLRQWEAAKDAGIAQSRLSALETGADPVRPGDVARLAPVLGLAPGDLLRAPRPARRRPAVTSSRATMVLTFKDIPVSCPCEWAMEFEGPRPCGWALAQAAPGCLHHGNGSSG